MKQRGKAARGVCFLKTVITHPSYRQGHHFGELIKGVRPNESRKRKKKVSGESREGGENGIIKPAWQEHIHKSVATQVKQSRTQFKRGEERET